ncbi:MAG: methyltransferase domain-containing protein [Thermotaleaceae bacterium]
MTGLKDRNTEMIEEVKDYWNIRSESYSKQNIAELHSFKRDAWRKMILENAPAKEKLKILDVGTGPGFFAINLALLGHDVTAVDCTYAMLDKASENARNYGVKVEFAQANADELPFDEGTFDLIVSRNVVWNLENPQRALKEWARVLKDEGHLIYFDANWYLYLFDEGLRISVEAAKKEAERLFPEEKDPAQAIGMNMEKIAYSLPLSRQCRPQWDRNAIVDCGLRMISLQEDIGEWVWEEKEKIRYAETPLFMVCAGKSK